MDSLHVSSLPIELLDLVCSSLLPHRTKLMMKAGYGSPRSMGPPLPRSGLEGIQGDYHHSKGRQPVETVNTICRHAPMPRWHTRARLHCFRV